MLQHVSCAAVLVTVLAIGAPVWAETPMSPLRRAAPPETAASPAQQWVEPPPALRPSAPENAAPGAEAEQATPPMRNSREGRRVARGRVWTTRELNRQQLYGGWSGVSVPYYRGYGPAPYSNSGD